MIYSEPSHSHSGSSSCRSDSGSSMDGTELAHLSLIHARYIDDPRALCRQLRHSYGSDNIDIKVFIHTIPIV